MCNVFFQNLFCHNLTQRSLHVGHPPRPVPFPMRTSSIKLPSAQFIEGFYPDAAGRAAELRDPNVGKWGDIVPLILVCSLKIMNKFAFTVDCALVFP